MSLWQSTSLDLRSLNHEQCQAVTHPQNVPLQILAGPGSGKTKVLTSRVAYLVRERGILPSQICCVTFTNKAANEMRERLTKLIGINQTDGLMMGTFHSICARFLRKYGSRISLLNNFTICDAEESKKIISKIMKSYAAELSLMSVQLKEGTVLASISKAKAKGLSPTQLERENIARDPINEIICRVYANYAAALSENNSLDFDDLLVYGVKLFTQEYKTVAWCRHVFVDEFQDTNSVQYELMVRLASPYRCITVVGDPDQSIYGWRSAETMNLGRMRTDFPATQQLFLKENYRSTGSILAVSLAIIAEDKSRIQRSLRTSHPCGTLPTLLAFATEQAEADFIASEIKRLVAYHRGLLSWNDFVVLLRYNALSRVVEAALQKEGIPNRVLAGQKFFERLEIKDILAYLQVIDNPSYTPAFNRAINTPPRGIGEKSIHELSARAKKTKISSMKLAERIVTGDAPDIKPAARNKLRSFVKSIWAVRKMANEGCSVPDLIQRLLLLVDYEHYLKKSQKDWETRWENVQELINFASQSENKAAPSNVEITAGVLGNEIEKNVIDAVSEDEETNLISSHETPLRTFLEASMLSTDSEAKEESEAGEVTISTCHSAKGLEWPVVFVPAVEKGTFPFYRADDVEEERRLLYVACTRAQGMLYLSHSTHRMSGGEWATREISEFISAVVKKHKALFSHSLPVISIKECHEIACLLGREPASESKVFSAMQDYNKSARLQPSAGINKSSFVFAKFNGPARGPDPCLVSGAESERAPRIFCRASNSIRHPVSMLSPTVSSSSALVFAPLPLQSQKVLGQSIKLAAGKRRLGMGRLGTGYPNKRPKGD